MVVRGGDFRPKNIKTIFFGGIDEIFSWKRGSDDQRTKKHFFEFIDLECPSGSGSQRRSLKTKEQKNNFLRA